MKQIFNGTYLIDGASFTQRLAIEINSITSLGAFYGHTNLNGKIVDSKGSWNAQTFHNEWQGGSADGVYSSEKGKITGTIRIGIKTGSFTLTIESSHTLRES